MDKDQFEKIKNDYIDHIKNFVKETGGLFPHFSVFAEIINPEPEEKDKPALIHIPIPDKYMEDDKAKDDFMEDVVPKLFKEVKKKFEPFGIAWASEAWMRSVNAPEIPVNYRDLPKTEVIIINIESQDICESMIFKMNRLGKQVNSDGDLVDWVELEQISEEKNPSLQGRFTGLFKKF